MNKYLFEKDLDQKQEWLLYAASLVIKINQALF